MNSLKVLKEYITAYLNISGVYVQAELNGQRYSTPPDQPPSSSALSTADTSDLLQASRETAANLVPRPPSGTDLSPPVRTEKKSERGKQVKAYLSWLQESLASPSFEQYAADSFSPTLVGSHLRLLREQAHRRTER